MSKFKEIKQMKKSNKNRLERTYNEQSKKEFF